MTPDKMVDNICTKANFENSSLFDRRPEGTELREINTNVRPIKDVTLESLGISKKMATGSARKMVNTNKKRPRSPDSQKIDDKPFWSKSFF